MKMTNIRNKTFCLTGTMKYTRDKMIEKIRTFGGYVDTKVGWRGDYLVVGTRPGRGKQVLAKQRNVTVIDEVTLLEWLGENTDGASAPIKKIVDKNTKERIINLTDEDLVVSLFVEEMRNVLQNYTDLENNKIDVLIERANAKVILKMMRKE